MSGNLVPTNVFVGSSPSLISRLDTDFTQYAAYINSRETTFDIFANRPAFGVPGRFYFATDTLVFYQDTGAAWQQLGPAVTAVATGPYQVRGLVGVNNPGTPNTRYDFSMDAVQVWNPTTFATLTFKAVATQTCDILVAGPAVNGRDQAGAFTNGTWVYFYEIAKTDGTKGLIASAVGWPTGPTLPAGYSLWAPLTAIFLSGGGALAATTVRGTHVYYKAGPNLFTGASGTAENTVSVANQIPPNAVEFWLDWTWFGAGGEGPFFRWASTFNYAPYPAPTTGTQSGQTKLPNVGQSFLWQVITNSRSTVIGLSSYAVPNGAC